MALTIPEILNTELYDMDEILIAGKECIAKHRQSYSTHVQEEWRNKFTSWDNCEIECITPVHSYETGYATMALLEIVGKDGQRSYMIYDCEKGGAKTMEEQASRFLRFEREIESDPKLFELLGSPEPEDVYYFHFAFNYGYGVLQDDGSIIIYDTLNYFETKMWGNPELKWMRVNQFKSAES